MPKQDRPATLKDAAVPAEVAERLRKVEPLLQGARAAISQGRAVGTETEERRLLAEERRRQRRIGAAIANGFRATATLDALQERQIGSDDILGIAFLARGLAASRSVGRLELFGGAETGTGFLVAADILATNNHVLPVPKAAANAVLHFELHDASGASAGMRECALSPGRFWFTDPTLDITLVALADDEATRAATAGLGWHPLIGQQGKIEIGDPVNIVQYPGGRRKSVVVHNSNLLHLENGTEISPFLWYSSDTERGSSGSPVFNRQWEVVGVHHRSVPKTNAAGQILDRNDRVMTEEEFKRDPDRAAWFANQGVRTSRIVEGLRQAAFADPAHDRVRDGLLVLWDASRLRNEGQAAAMPAAPPGGANESFRRSDFALSPGVTIRVTLEAPEAAGPIAAAGAASGPGRKAVAGKAPRRASGRPADRAPAAPPGPPRRSSRRSRP